MHFLINLNIHVPSCEGTYRSIIQFMTHMKTAADFDDTFCTLIESIIVNVIKYWFERTTFSYYLCNNVAMKHLNQTLPDSIDGRLNNSN